MAIAFKYKTIDRPKPLESIKCPVVPLTLMGRETIEYIGLLDSGADVSVIDYDIAEILGLDLSGKQTDSLGVGGRVKTIRSEVRINFSKGHEGYTFAMPVLVLPRNSGFGMMLLGRKGFFDRFVITFDESHGRVMLKKNEPKTY